MKFFRNLPDKKERTALAALFFAAVSAFAYRFVLASPEDAISLLSLALVLVMSRHFTADTRAFYLRVALFALVLLSSAVRSTRASRWRTCRSPAVFSCADGCGASRSSSRTRSLSSH